MSENINSIPNITSSKDEEKKMINMVQSNGKIKNLRGISKEMMIEKITQNVYDDLMKSEEYTKLINFCTSLKAKEIIDVNSSTEEVKNSPGFPKSKEILMNEFDQDVSKYLTQPEILNKIIKSCFAEDFEGSEFFRDPKSSNTKFKYVDINSIDNIEIKNFKSEDIIYHKIDFNLCFSLKKYKCNSNGKCECNILHSGNHGLDNCIHCIWKEDAFRYTLNKILSLFYISSFNDKKIDLSKLEKILQETLKSLSLKYENPKVFFVYNYDMISKGSEILSNYGIIKVRLGSSFDRWLSTKKENMSLLF